MTLQPLIYNLVNQLDRHGVAVHIKGGRVQVSLPWPPAKIPGEVKALLQELKIRETTGQLQQWDEEEALAIFRATVERIKRRYPADAWPWATENRPELRQAVKDAESLFNEAYQRQDMAGVRLAVAEYEKTFGVLIDTYNQQRQLSPEEIINAFDCDRVWELPGGKAAKLDAVFAKEGIRWE